MYNWQQPPCKSLGLGFWLTSQWAATGLEGSSGCMGGSRASETRGVTVRGLTRARAGKGDGAASSPDEELGKAEAVAAGGVGWFLSPHPPKMRLEAATRVPLVHPVPWGRRARRGSSKNVSPSTFKGPLDGGGEGVGRGCQVWCCTEGSNQALKRLLVGTAVYPGSCGAS